jgi:hypothetical protein
MSLDNGIDFFLNLSESESDLEEDTDTDFESDDDMDNMICAKDVYTKVLQLSYDKDPQLFFDLNNSVVKKVGYAAFNCKTHVTMNRFDRFDVTFGILRGTYGMEEFYRKSDMYCKVFKDDTYFDLTRLNNNIESDAKIMINNIKSTSNEDWRTDMIKNSIDRVRAKATHHLNQITTIDGLIDQMKLRTYSKELFKQIMTMNITDNNYMLFADLWAISLIEPFHEWVIECIIWNPIGFKQISYVLSEYDKTELEYIADIGSDLLYYITNEYPSHSMLIVFDDQHLYAYDPDDNMVFANDKLVLGRTVIHSNIARPIQTIIDDIYCIFHSIFAMIEIANIQSKCVCDSDNNNLIKIINAFELVQNNINSRSDVEQYTHNKVYDLVELYPPCAK